MQVILQKVYNFLPRELRYSYSEIPPALEPPHTPYIYMNEYFSNIMSSYSKSAVTARGVLYYGSDFKMKFKRETWDSLTRQLMGYGTDRQDLWASCQLQNSKKKMFVEWKTNMRALCFSRQVFTPLLTISTNILRVLHNQYMHVSYRLLNCLSLIIKLDGKFTRSVHILTYCWYTVSENPVHVVSYLVSVVAALPSIDSILFIHFAYIPF